MAAAPLVPSSVAIRGEERRTFAFAQPGVLYEVGLTKVLDALREESAKMRVMEPALGIKEPVARPLLNHEAQDLLFRLRQAVERAKGRVAAGELGRCVL